MDASELRARACQEADELGPEPPGAEAELWREERWGAVVKGQCSDGDEVQGVTTTNPFLSRSSPRAGQLRLFAARTNQSNPRGQCSGPGANSHPSHRTKAGSFRCYFRSRQPSRRARCHQSC